MDDEYDIDKMLEDIRDLVDIARIPMDKWQPEEGEFIDYMEKEYGNVRI